MNSSIGGGFVGLLIAGFAIYKEEQGLWQMADSMLFFAICFIVLLPVSYLLWQRVRFESLNNV